MEMENWLLSALVLIIFPMSLCFLFHKKRGINREKEEKVGESSNQEQVSGDPPVFEHEVFLSFYGDDTRKNFTDHLYSHLEGIRIRTFRDREKLHVGEKIGDKLMEAIKKSKIMIPIFSKGYASSKWCLMELTHMVKCVEGNKERAMICPIFYDVTPSEVRNQTGSFEAAFVRHTQTKDLDKKTVDEWKEALRKVPEVKGWERDKIADGHESELVKEVGTKVLMQLKKMHVEVTKHLVGMDQHEAELKQLLDLVCNDVKIVGIVGMGGIGKTTIARFIYNKLCDDEFHQRCSFLQDVQEKVKQSGGLVDLQKKLLSDILKRTSDKVQMNPSTLKTKKCLIVVDNVANRSQLEKIIGGCDRFGPGSRIIVTTRNRGTFIEQEEQEGEKIYEPREMNPDNALRLFCKHAFRRDFPREGYEDLSRKVVSKVAGLPLSLEVIGSLLYTKKRKGWEEALEKLEKIMPKEVQESLQISYDMLEDGQKEIFLDIACHFIYSYEEKRRAASYMWKDYGFFPVSGIEALVTLSLVKIDEYGRFTMHDQLRDLGREIVRKQDSENPGNRSRLWSNEDAREVLTSKSGTKRVRTLSLDFFWQDPLSNKEFKGLYGLRYLDLSRTSNLTGDFKGLLSELRWFRWWSSQSQITEITNFCLPKLVVLDLSRSDISDGWEDRIQIKEAKNLKVLDLSHCTKLTKTPDLSAFAKLERLNLEQCTSLVEISPSLGHLQHLEYLNLNTSSESKWKLPESIWNLKSLVELHMRYLGVTELSEDIGNLTNLTILDVGETDIKKLPNAFGKLEKLETLRVSECKSLEELPETIGDLRSLIRLDVEKSKVKRLPSAIGRLEKLEELDAENCTFLGELPENIANLTNLRRLRIGNSKVKRLPSAIGGLEKLEELDAENCTFLGELPENIANLTNLRRLRIGNSKVKGLPSAIGLLQKLEWLDVADCIFLRELPDSIVHLTNLRRLRIGNSKVKRLPSAIGGLEKLEELDAENCIFLEELPENIANLTNLRRLRIGNSKVKGLPSAIGLLKKLEWLDVADCKFLRELPESIVHLENLRSLCIRRSRVKGLPRKIELLKKLEELDASDCKLLGELPESIGKLRNLRILRVSSSGIEKLPAGIETLQKLEKLDCSYSSLEGELPGGVWSLSALTELNLNNTKISSLLPADISRCSHLTTLDLGSCPDLRLPSSELKLPTGLERLGIPLTKSSLDSVVRLPELKRLAFHLCDRTDLGEFPIDLGGLPQKLEVLRFYGFNHYPSVPVKINNLPRLLRVLGIRSDNLEEWYQFDECELVLALDGCESPLLKLDGCESLERLPDLPNALKVIRIHNCPKLSDIGSLSGLTSLVKLDIKNCPSLPAQQWLEKQTIKREKEEKVGESSNQEQVSGDPPEEFEHEMLLSSRGEEEKVGESRNQEQVSDDPPEEFEHEVFLSFRGVDTRTNFTDHLYSYLTDLRIHTFRDNEKLHVGEKIGTKLMEAIKQSKILIPIFSKGYASSEWCLMELTYMVKRVEIDDRVLICPIFYDVTPSEVRNQTGIFKAAFVRHTDNFDKETVDEWKEALRKVPEVKGWEKDKIAKGHESELVKEVVTKVLMLLKKKHVKVTEHLVGMDQHEAELMQLLDLDLGCNDVKIVGIVGMGGIGKTTIAKFIYNKLCDDKFHQRCSFLQDVREKVKRSGGPDVLKKQLMGDILKRAPDGVQMNQSTLKKTKALIVVDDVDNSSQLMEIIGGCDWFGPESRIIVTTRNRDTFREKGEKVYEPGVMNPDNALLLFCKHAFRRDRPPEGYEALSEKMVSEVAGLPLSLEVIGSLLYTKKREVWDETLKKLEKIIPEKVRDRLQISYNMLDGGQKEIFLDIACHFINSYKNKRRAASYMWEDCEFFPVAGIEVLVTLSLVKIDEYGRFTMHDQLRDLGREIVREQGPQNPGYRSRLWSHEVALDVLTSKRGTERVETLTLDFFWQNPLSNEEFKGLYGLRYLDLSRTSNLTGDFEGLLSELRWFRWWSSQSQITEITNFCLPKLVVLDLSQSSISDGWEDRIQIKKATNLKVLDLSHCTKLTKTPDLSAFAKLERLNLEQCTSLVEISPSLGHLQHLEYLNLNTSSESKWKLPESIWNLKSLVELHMRYLGVTELSEDIGNLTNLTILDVGETDIFGKLVFGKLETLRVSERKSLEELPKTIGNLRSLRQLDITGSKVKRLPSEIELLAKLEWLSVTGCELLGELPGIVKLTNLRSLYITRSGVNRLPPEIGRLEKLEALDARDCKLLGELPESIGKLRNLRSLGVRSSGIKKLPAGIGMLKKLEELDCSCCSSLEGELPSGVWSLSALTELNLNNTKISSLLPADISCCSHLMTLDLGSCPYLRLPSSELKLPPGLVRLEIPLTKASLDSVVRLPKLERLIFHQCDRTDLELPIDLGRLPHELEELIFFGFKNYTSVPVKINSLPWLPSLSIQIGGTENVYMRIPDGFKTESQVPSLWLKNCESLERLSDLHNKLEKIRIYNCPKLCDIDSLADLGSLAKLVIENCESLKKLPDLPNALLEKVRIHNCPKLFDINSLSVLSSWGELDIENCESLEGLPDLHKDLCKIIIHNCPKLFNFDGLANLRYLEELDIENCESLKRLSDLPNTSEKIRIHNCPKLCDIDSLADLQSLAELDIENCESLKKLPDLPKASLGKIRIYNCPKLFNFDSLANLKHLVELDIEKCESLKRLPDLPNTSLENLKLVDCPSLEKLPHLPLLNTQFGVIYLENCGTENELDESEWES